LPPAVRTERRRPRWLAWPPPIRQRSSSIRRQPHASAATSRRGRRSRSSSAGMTRNRPMRGPRRHPLRRRTLPLPSGVRRSVPRRAAARAGPRHRARAHPAALAAAQRLPARLVRHPRDTTGRHGRGNRTTRTPRLTVPSRGKPGVADDSAVPQLNPSSPCRLTILLGTSGPDQQGMLCVLLPDNRSSTS